MDRIEKIYKSDNNRIFFGVASGIAEYLDCNPDIIRLIFALLVLANGLGIVLYIILIFIFPTYKQILEQEDKNFLEQAILNPTSGQHYVEDTRSEEDFLKNNIVARENIVAYILIIIGVIFMAFNIIPWGLIPDEYQVPFIITLLGGLFIAKALIYKEKTI